MSRVLVAGAAGTIGAAVVRRLLGNPAYEVRVADLRPVPQWMREGCEVHSGDLRDGDQARAASRGCEQIVHLAALGGGVVRAHRLAHTLLDANAALCSALVGAAVREGVERFTYVSCASVFEGATEFPSTEAHLRDCPPPARALGFSKLAGELYCRAAHDEHGLPFTIARAASAYGPGELPAFEPGVAHVVADLIRKTLGGQRPLAIFGSGEQTRAFTHVDDIAAGILAALDSPAALNEDFNICAEREVTVAELAGVVWNACGEDPSMLALECLPGIAHEHPRQWPSAAKARALLGWEAQITLERGIAATVTWLRENGRVRSGS
jgi:UDP-glucose 4-epimerase